MKNIRFWDWVNGGWVKLTLHYCEGRYTSIRHEVGGATVEGYSYSVETWECPDGIDVTCECVSLSIDCDGRYDSYSSYTCSREELAGRQVDDIRAPMWKAAGSSQQDYNVESGY